MRSHDEIESIQRERAATVPSSQPMGADLAARALAAGRTEPLGADAMFHLQRSAGNASVARLVSAGRDDQADSPGSEVRSLIGRSGGSLLDEGTRTSMEARFGQDFGSVRVHTDGQAASAARALSAQAFTVGNEIAFAPGRYDPGSETGQRTLAHELTHVTQQRAGAVDGSPIPGGVRMSHPSDRFEQAASQNADRIIGAGAPPVAPSAPIAAQREAIDGGSSAQPLPVQRAAPEEEEADDTAQTLPVQRQAPEEEEADDTAQTLPVQRQGPEEEEEPAAG